MTKIVLIVSLAVVLAGCETIKGAGRDMYRGAAAVAKGVDTPPVVAAGY